MFDRIAGRYDADESLSLSVRTDIGWRKKAIRKLKKYNPQNILDVATGTADMAILASKMLETPEGHWDRYLRRNAGNRKEKD